MTTRWQFTQNDWLQWRWSRIEGEDRQESAASFENPMRCVLDAVRSTVNAHRARGDVQQAAAEGASQVRGIGGRDTTEFVP